MKKIFQWAAQFAFLRPYNSRLLTPGANLWLIGVLIIISIMALSEGIIWSLLFNFLLARAIDSPIRWIMCTGIGIIVFSVIWLLDTSFATLDTTEQSGQKSKSFLGLSQDRIKRLWLPLLFRIAIVVGSLVITMPAMTKLTVAPDIEAYLKKENIAIQKEARDKIEKGYDQKLFLLDSLILNKNNEVTREIAGKGITSSKGRGSTAKALEKELEDLKQEKENTKLEQQQVLSDFDKMSPEELERIYGVQYVIQSAGEINRVANLLSDKKSYQDMERISMAFLALLFLALVLFKVFAPRSVKIYFNEQLQDFYSAYLSKQIQPHLTQGLGNNQGLSHGELTAYQVEEFWKDTYQKRLREHQKETQPNDKLKSSVAELSSNATTWQHELDEHLHNKNEAKDKHDKLVTDLLENKEKTERAEEQVEQYESKLDALNQSRRSGALTTQDLVIANREQQEIEREIKVLQEELLRLRLERNQLEAKKERMEFLIKQINEALTILQDNFKNLNEAKGRFRDAIIGNVEDLLDD